VHATIPSAAWRPHPTSCSCLSRLCHASFTTQPFPHTSFEHEALFLRQHFGHLGHGGSAYVLGDMFNGLQWHVYVADAHGPRYADALHPAARPTYKLEVCMTQLSPAAAAPFFRDPTKPAPTVSAETGIAGLLPGAVLDDYVFEPCGYSANGILGGGLLTVHITPEEGFSYASVELAGFEPGDMDPVDMVARVLAIFRPGRASVSLSVDAAGDSARGWAGLDAAPAGYGCQSATCQELATGGRVSYYTLGAAEAETGTTCPPSSLVSKPAALPAVTSASVGSGGPPRPLTPALLLRHMPTFGAQPSECGSDVDLASSGSADEVEAALRGLPRDGLLRSGSTSPGASAPTSGAVSGGCAACRKAGPARSTVALRDGGSTSGASSAEGMMEA
jgi:S-adenosylmethionine decarboxylase proenzyme